jgi:hypothetical protein
MIMKNVPKPTMRRFPWCFVGTHETWWWRVKEKKDEKVQEKGEEWVWVWEEKKIWKKVSRWINLCCWEKWEMCVLRKVKGKEKLFLLIFFCFFFSLPLPPTNQVDFFYVIFVSFHLQCIYSIVVEADLNVRITRIKWNIRKHKFDLSCVGETKKKTHKNFSSYPKNMKTPLNTSEEEKPFFMWAFFHGKEGCERQQNIIKIMAYAMKEKYKFKFFFSSSFLLL